MELVWRSFSLISQTCFRLFTTSIRTKSSLGLFKISISWKLSFIGIISKSCRKEFPIFFANESSTMNSFPRANIFIFICVRFLECRRSFCKSFYICLILSILLYFLKSSPSVRLRCLRFWGVRVHLKWLSLSLVLAGIGFVPRYCDRLFL